MQRYRYIKMTTTVCQTSGSRSLVSRKGSNSCACFRDDIHWLLQCYLCRPSKDDHRWVATSAQYCHPSSQQHTEVRSWSVDTPAWQTALAGCARENHLQAQPHDIPLPAWTSTSVPCRLHHFSHRSHILTSPTFQQSTPADVPRCRLNMYGHRVFPVPGSTV